MQFVAACVLLREYREDPDASDYATAQERGLEMHIGSDGIVTCQIESVSILTARLRFALCESATSPGRDVWAIQKLRFGRVAEFPSLAACHNFTEWLAEQNRDACLETASLVTHG